jgi:replicative DNA helicase
MNINKSLPNNIQTEQSALGSIIKDQGALMATIGFLKIEDFYLKKHQIIYRNILSLVDKNQAIDLVTLSEELKKTKTLEEVGGITYLTEIINSVPTPANIRQYNQIIIEKSALRNMIIQLNKILTLCYEDKDPKLILEKIQNMAVNILPEEEEKSLGELLKNTLISSSKGVKYRFKLESLNKVLGGVDIGEIITIGGYTSQGKTSLALQLCKDFCEKNLKVLYCTSEMSDQETARRLLANLQEKNIMDFRRGKFTENEKESLKDFIDLIVNTWGLQIKEVFSMTDIKRYVYKYEPHILFIDYLQNLSRKNEKNDYQKVTHDMQDIQILTRDKKITTFILSQLSRNKEDIRKPRLSDLRDSGAIEEKSNIVLLVYWENRLKQEIEPRTGNEPPEKMEIIIAKNRDGTIGTIYLDYYPEFGKLDDRKY